MERDLATPRQLSKRALTPSPINLSNTPRSLVLLGYVGRASVPVLVESGRRVLRSTWWS